MGLTPLDLISAHPWQRVAFTTYALSLSFFEAVILDALARGGGSAHPVVLADIHGVRGSLSEQGAHSVGRAYEVEPVAVSGGVFHPKITVLTADKECHLLVGSGNLTFNQPENNLKPTSEVRKVSPDKEGISSVHVQSREVIKIRCSRCHMLVDEDAKFCPSCGSLMG